MAHCPPVLSPLPIIEHPQWPPGGGARGARAASEDPGDAPHESALFLCPEAVFAVCGVGQSSVGRDSVRARCGGGGGCGVVLTEVRGEGGWPAPGQSQVSDTGHRRTPVDSGRDAARSPDPQHAPIPGRLGGRPNGEVGRQGDRWARAKCPPCPPDTRYHVTDVPSVYCDHFPCACITL